MPSTLISYQELGGEAMFEILAFLFIGLIPLGFIIAFSGLELGIAFIQAQVFVVLTSSYIKDALDLH